MELKIQKQKERAQLQSIASRLEGEQEERQTIASTLHDNVSALLAGASMHIQAYKKKTW